MNIFFVSLSDLHLGEEDSLLTNLSVGEPRPNTQGPSPCMTALVNYLHAIKRTLNEDKPIPNLILNGDILELATGSYPLAVAFCRIFLTELAKHRIFDRIVYLAGNHDHALWSLIRDTHFVEFLGQTSETDNELKVSHIIPLSTARQSSILDNLVSNLPMKADPIPFLVANPAFRLTSSEGYDFIFHHGHFLEDIYKMMTLLRDRLISDTSLDQLKSKPLRENIEQIERENWPWIDFVWSGFVRAGRVGKAAEAIYELIIAPGGAKTLIERVAEILDNEMDIPVIPDFLEDNAFRYILGKALSDSGVGSVERADPDKAPFSGDLKQKVKRFLNHYIKNELYAKGLHPAEDKTSFVFGHTHKPFIDKLPTDSDKYDFGKVSIINSGGWVVESSKPQLNYGPGIVLGDNGGKTALISCKLDKDPTLKAKGSWNRELRKMNEYKELELAITKAVKIRRNYFEKRMKSTERLLKKLKE